MENKKVRVAFYIRVSTSDQAKTWHWLDYQLQSLQDLVKYRSTQDPAWVTHKKWIYEDSWWSGSDLLRPQYQKMLEDAKNGEFDMIAVWKIDRMSRNLSHLLKTFEDLKSYGVWFYSIKENIDFTWPIWKLTFQIFWALAEFEREMIKARTIEWKIASARSGNYVKPGVPYGYIKVPNPSGKWNKLEIVEEEAKIVKMVFSKFVYDDLTYSDIGRELTSMNIKKWLWAVRKDIENTPWHDTTIKTLLNYTEYIWETEWSIDNKADVNITLITPQIIPKDLFRIAQIRVKEIEEGYKAGTRKYLLSGKIIDVETGKSFIWVVRSKGWHSYRRKWFTASNGDKIKNMEMPWESLDTFVWGHILDFIKTPKNFLKLYKKQTTELNKIDVYNQEIDILTNKLNWEEVKRENIDKQLLTGRFSEEKADKYMKESVTSSNQMKKRVRDLEKHIEYLLNLELTEGIIHQVSKNYLKNIDNLSLDQKMRIIELLVNRVDVTVNKHNDMEVEVIFRFAPDMDNQDGSKDEPSKSLWETKKHPNGCLKTLEWSR